MQKQFGDGSPGTQVVYFWQPLVLERCQEAQMLCIPHMSRYKINDVIILPEMD